ncbi:29897_t:CDS:2 [Gigaspora margarita]|uniref:29897_t:CDS:1 n=1 Tax=Gigaspora margarita TaxID=4874 RepID=A0ABN7VQ05_GIGMA|nr:29897_t:CDS:2 [Gigaspora margarita]
MSDQQLTGSELLKDKYLKSLQDVQDITQRNIALFQDRNDLNQANTVLQARIEELMKELEQLTKTIEELTKSNNAFKIILQITENERNFYKSSNFEEFNKFIENYIIYLYNLY